MKQSLQITALGLIAALLLLLPVCGAETSVVTLVGDAVRVQLLSDTVIRVEAKDASGFEDRATLIAAGRANFSGVAAATRTEGDNLIAETDRYVVTLEDNSLMKETEAQIRAVDGVSDVNAPYEIINGFQTVQKVLNIASAVIIAVLFVVSLLIISNTVKLAMYSRSEEIAIMKMVGATNSFIRMPFVVEGFILGFLGALIAFFLQWGLYDFVAMKVAEIDSLQLITVAPFLDVIEPVALIYALTGFVVGVFGSLLSIRKFLKV